MPSSSSMLLYIFNGAADSSCFSGVEVSDCYSLLLVCVGLNTQHKYGLRKHFFCLSGCLNIDLVLNVHFKQISLYRMGNYMCVWCCNMLIIIFFIMAPITLLDIDNGFDKPKYILGRLHFQTKRAIWNYGFVHSP